MNINRLVLTRQRKLLAIVVGAVIFVVGILYAANRQAVAPATADETPADAAAPEPDLTGGTVSNTFDGNGQNSLLIDSQRREQEAKEHLLNMEKQFKGLQEQLSELLSNNQTLKQNVDDLTQKLNTAQTQPGATAQAQGGGYMPPRTEYAMGPAPVQTGQIDNALLDYSKWQKKPRDTSFWVPTGTFSDAIVIEGADTNASVRGEKNLVPMQFKLKGLARLPGNNRLNHLDNCFVTAAAYGDISSERAVVQLQRLSCIIDGKHIDQEVKGHVAFYGKAGIKGVPVMRNGKILGLAFASGAIGGLGQSASQVGQTVAGLGATASLSGGDVARSAAGNGVSKAADKLADYYIERAEQYHPIIPIGAANRVEVVFIEGFRAKFIEDEEAAQLAKEADKAVDDATTQSTGNSGLPPELVGKLGDATRLNMNDFVAPVAGQRPGATTEGAAQ